MIQPMQHQTPFPRTSESFEKNPDPTAHLRTPVSLLVHMETVLGGQRARVGHHRTLALTGNVHLPELRAEIAFRSHGGQSGHSELHWATATIIPRRSTMTIPPQYLALPAREGSDVWALTPAPHHDPPWIEHYAGQLEREPLTFNQHVPVDVTLDVTFTPVECQNGRGTRVDVAGELHFERSVRMRLLFRGPEDSMAPPLESENDEAVLIVAGSRVPITHRTVSGLGGRDAWITVRVIEAGGRVVYVEQLLTVSARRAS